MAQAMAGAGLPEHLAAIAIAVVGHDPLDHDAVAGKPGERTVQEGGGGFLALVRQDFTVASRQASSMQTCRHSQPIP